MNLREFVKLMPARYKYTRGTFMAFVSASPGTDNKPVLVEMPCWLTNMGGYPVAVHRPIMDASFQAYKKDEGYPLMRVNSELWQVSEVSSGQTILSKANAQRTRDEAMRGTLRRIKSLPGDYDEVFAKAVLRALAKQPERRYTDETDNIIITDNQV